MLKNILMISTGGTIACQPQEDGGLAPAITSEQLIREVPELSEICNIDCYQLYNVDSTNMGPENWKGIVKTITTNLGKYDGFVITHGTDTMAYTAAALSYMIQNPPVPIVFTGSQKSIALRDTDARNNLLCAFRYAASDGAWGVQIAFDGEIILGTRARKVRSKSFNAFASIGYPDTAIIRDDRVIQYMPRPAVWRSLRTYENMNSRVFVIRLIPGISLDILNYMKENYDAIVIEAFGVGGLPNYNNGALLKAIKDWTDCGKLAVFSTQVQFEGSDIGVYEVGRIFKDYPGIIEAKDMTPEAIATKLMWVLAQTTDREEAEKLFLTPIQNDIL